MTNYAKILKKTKKIKAYIHDSQIQIYKIMTDNKNQMNHV